jgi:hypothetical protein
LRYGGDRSQVRGVTISTKRAPPPDIPGGVQAREGDTVTVTAEFPDERRLAEELLRRPHQRRERAAYSVHHEQTRAHA